MTTENTPNGFAAMLDGMNPELMEQMKKMGEAIKAHGKQEQRQKIKNYAQLNEMAQKGGILFTGSSLMEQFPICEMCVDAGIDRPVYNRGVGGFTTDDFLENIGVQLLDLEPSKVFINIGTNDMSPDHGDDWMDRLLTNYRSILTQCRETLPETEVYLMAYYPVNAGLDRPDAPFYVKAMMQIRTNENIARLNDAMASLAEELGYHFINVNDGLTDEQGNLKAAYTIEGVHMYADAYKHVFRNLKPYIL